MQRGVERIPKASLFNRSRPLMHSHLRPLCCLRNDRNDREAFSFSRLFEVKQVFFHATPNDRSDVTSNSLNVMLPGLMHVEFAH